MALAVPLATRVQLLAATPFPARVGTDTAVSAAARNASAEALDRGETHYTDRPGIKPLRERLAAHLSGRFGMTADANGMVITCGVTEARFVAIQQLVSVGGRIVALDQPERIAGACVVRGAELVGPEHNGAGVEAIYLSSDADPAHRQRYLALAVAQQWAIIYEPGDDAGPADHPAASGAAALCITVGSLGHAEGIEGWRTGYLAAPVEKAGPLRDFKQALTLCTTNLSQWGTLALMEENA
jgi:aspartate/methionine/tyrosine aminotransferase